MKGKTKNDPSSWTFFDVVYDMPKSSVKVIFKLRIEHPNQKWPIIQEIYSAKIPMRMVNFVGIFSVPIALRLFRALIMHKVVTMSNKYEQKRALMEGISCTAAILSKDPVWYATRPIANIFQNELDKAAQSVIARNNKIFTKKD